MTGVRSGQVKYGARAFEQDAGHAIRGDIVRALIEFITNADDAYGGHSGDIRVHVAATGDPAFPVALSVHDAAKGLDADGLVENFGELGGEKEDNEGSEHVRGLLGRGAKDVASLGPVTFEAVHDGLYSQFDLHADGSWRLLHENEPVDDVVLDRLCLDEGQNGLSTTVRVAQRHSVMKRANLVQKLTHHAQLRDLLSRRPVKIQDRRTDNTLLKLEAPTPTGEIIIDEEIPLNGYEPVRLIVRRLSHRGQGHVTDFTEHGLLIKSGVSVFENTWFDLDRRQESSWFSGVIEAPQITSIIKAFDAQKDLGGPMRLLSRDRDGLVKVHPYRQELARAVMVKVQPVFDELAKQMDAGRRQGASLNRAFKVARDALRDQLNSVMSEIEAQEPGGEGPARAEALILVPPVRFVSPGESVTLTVRALQPPSTVGLAIVESSSGDDVVASVECGTEWGPHARLAAFQTTMRLDAGLEIGSAIVRVTFGNLAARARIVVVDPLEEEVPELPTGIEMTPARASVAPGRGKRLSVRAPIEHSECEISISTEGVPLASVPTSLQLRPEPGGRWAQASLRVEATSECGEAVVTATLEGEGKASSKLQVDESEGRGGLDVSFDLLAHKSPNRRVELEDQAGVLRVKIYGLHQSFAGLFGPYSDEKAQFEAEDTAQSRAVIAEVVAQALSTYCTEREYDRKPEELNDATRVLRRTAERATRFQAILHRALAPVGD
jgi:hypothetical protein